jgi:tripartite-type tricarboxylate transporter receptor subunit TctC
MNLRLSVEARLRVLQCLACCLLAATVARGGALAQTYPDRPVRMLVGFAAGGSADLAARVIADGLTTSLGKPVLIENRPGAGSIIAATAVARADPDGYVLLFGSIALSVQAAIDPAIPLDPLVDLAPVGLVAEAPNVLVVHPPLPVQSVNELVTYARTHPVSFASSGVGTTLHLAGEMLKERAKIDIVHVPYKGSAPALTDLMAGRVQMMFDNIVTSMPLIKAGKIRPLAVTTARRNRQLPQVPTMVEAGFRDFETSVWFGIFAPGRTPKAVIDRLAAAIAASQSDPRIAPRFEPLNMDPMRSESPERFAEFFRRDIDQWKTTVARSGVKVEKN